MATNKTVAVVGLGYVGLPLALAFGKKIPTIGFDISKEKMRAYREGKDPTNEQESEKFHAAKQLQFTDDPARLAEADFLVIAVPTPVDDAKLPDLNPVKSATRTVAKHLKKGAIVIYESTVWPGLTEEICVPLLEKESGKKCGPDFKVGYSPERINPGDKEHTLERIVKVVAGQDAESSKEVAWLYNQVIEAGVFEAASIKVAEAAKVIENTQRDLNIALMNELAIIFKRMGIDTVDVLKAAGTKWNFLPFRPGLVGGHCIGVDPYYLTFQAQKLGYQPEVILAGRRINDSMGKVVAEATVKRMIASEIPIKGAKVLVMGLTFKENCGDVRNTRVIDVIQELESYGIHPTVWDPVADKDVAEEEYKIHLSDWKAMPKIDAVIAAVAHKAVVEINLKDLMAKGRPGMPFIDVKAAFDRKTLADIGFTIWRL